MTAYVRPPLDAAAAPRQPRGMDTDRDEALTTPAQWAQVHHALLAHLGDVAAAAAWLGVGEATVARWAAADPSLLDGIERHDEGE